MALPLFFFIRSCRQSVATMNSSYASPSSSSSNNNNNPTWTADFNTDDLDLFPPSGKRLAPVGANAEDDALLDENEATLDKAKAELELMQEEQQLLLLGGGGGGGEGDACELKRRLREMEDEQEELNSSLMSMTSHFAKVRTH